MGHQSYVLLCTENTLSNPPVVQPKSSCDVHLLRSPCLVYLNYDRQRQFMYSALALVFAKIKYHM